jgi:hypothetical protein
LNINSLKDIMEVQSYYKPHITEFSYITKFSSPLKQGIKRTYGIMLGKTGRSSFSRQNKTEQKRVRPSSFN